MQTINNKFWKKAKVSENTLVYFGSVPCFYNGVWYDGIWFDGFWYGQVWINGFWENGEISICGIYRQTSNVSPKVYFKPEKTISLNKTKYETL